MGAEIAEHWLVILRPPPTKAKPAHAGAPADYVGGVPGREYSAKGAKWPRFAQPEGRPKAARTGDDG
eukprot:3252732-Pyramimonas_sp.AAC.1